MAKRTTVFDLWSQKGKKKWPQTHIDTSKEAEAAYKAGIEIISCEPDHHFKEVRKVAPTAFLSVGLRHGSVSSPQEACLLYTSPSPRDGLLSRMPSSA